MAILIQINWEEHIKNRNITFLMRDGQGQRGSNPCCYQSECIGDGPGLKQTGHCAGVPKRRFSEETLSQRRGQAHGPSKAEAVTTLYWFARAARTRYHKLDSLNNSNLFSHNSEVQRSEIRVW